MNNVSKAPEDDLLPWAPPRVGVPVERRDAWEVVMHGARAGLLAGIALAGVEITASTLLADDRWWPFDFAAALIVGPEALAPSFPLAASLALGTVLHVLLSIGFGVAFLAGLALAFQLSARPSLLRNWQGASIWRLSSGTESCRTALCMAPSSRCMSSGCVLACSIHGGAPTDTRHDAAYS